MSATSYFDFLICAWCARLSIAGLWGGGNGGLFRQRIALVADPVAGEAPSRKVRL
jgi:hypothetical protein